VLLPIANTSDAYLDPESDEARTLRREAARGFATIENAETREEVEAGGWTIGFDMVRRHPTMKIGDHVLINTVAMQGCDQHALVTALCPKNPMRVQVVWLRGYDKPGRTQTYNTKCLVLVEPVAPGPDWTTLTPVSLNQKASDEPVENSDLAPLRKRAEDAAVLEAALERLAGYIDCAHTDDVFQAVRFKLDHSEDERLALRQRVTDLEDELHADAPERKVLAFKLRAAYCVLLLAFGAGTLTLVKLGTWLF
jgi:hypothetical protein